MHENEQDAREGSWGLCCLRMCLDFPPAGKQNLTEHRTRPRPHAQPQADPDRTAQGRARTGRSFCALVMPPPCFGLEPRAGRHVYKNKDRKEKGKKRLLLLPQRREENEQGGLGLGLGRFGIYPGVSSPSSSACGGGGPIRWLRSPTLLITDRRLA